MNECCKHLFREAKKEIEIRDKRIKELQDECTRLFEPTREFWNKGLQAENKKLREALIKIANDRTPPWDKKDYQDVAREALKEVGN